MRKKIHLLLLVSLAIFFLSEEAESCHPTIGSSNLVGLSSTDVATTALFGIPVEFGVSAAQSQVQSWKLVSCDPTEMIRGGKFTIHSIDKLPLNLPWSDGDWNIMVTPHAGSEELLFNSVGNRNSNGRIELEIKTELPFQNYLQEGDPIFALGFHVEDLGHSFTYPNPNIPAGAGGGKTELHPIIFIRKGEIRDNFVLLAAQDMSNRFVTASVDTINFIDFFGGFVINLGEVVRVNLLNPGVNVMVPLLEETAKVDFGRAKFTTVGTLIDQEVRSSWAVDHSSILATQVPGTVNISPNLKGQARFLEPLYIGEFNRSSLPLLQHTVVTTLRTYADQTQEIVASVSPTLLDLGLWSGYDSFAFTQWFYEDESGSHVAVNPFGRSLLYTLRYSPALARNKHEWALDVVASTRQTSWSPGAARISAGLGDPEKRVFAQARVRYQINPSSLDLNVQEITSQFSPGPGVVRIISRATDSVTCTTGYELNANVSKAHPDVQFTMPLRWHIHLEQMADGQPGPVVGFLQEGTPLEVGSVHFTVPIGEPNKLRVNFKNTVVLPGGGGLTGGSVLMYKNAARVQVTATYITRLGENPTQSRDLSTPPCYANFPSFQDLLATGEKLFAMWRLLSEIGPGIPDSLPKQWSSEFLRKWKQISLPLGYPRTWYAKLPPEGQRHARSFMDLIGGKSVDQRAVDELFTAMARVSKLPDLKRQLAPPLISREILSGAKQTPLFELPAIYSKSPSELIRGKPYVADGLVFDKDNNLSRTSIRALVEWARLIRADRRGIQISYVTGGRSVSELEARNRAERIKRILVMGGVRPDLISTSGKVQAQVPDPGRVEISIR